MEKGHDNVVMRLPVTIKYTALQDYIQNELIGEVIKKESKNGEVDEYAEILEVSLAKSSRENFDLVLHLGLRTLTTFFKDKNIQVNVHLALLYDPAAQEIRVENYSLEGENNSWLMNKFLQVLANSVMYSSLKEKMRFNLGEVLDEKVAGLNLKLSDQVELFSGMAVSGDLSQVELVELIPNDDSLFVSILVSANVFVEINKIQI